MLEDLPVHGAQARGEHEARRQRTGWQLAPREPLPPRETRRERHVELRAPEPAELRVLMGRPAAGEHGQREHEQRADEMRGEQRVRSREERDPDEERVSGDALDAARRARGAGTDHVVRSSRVAREAPDDQHEAEHKDRDQRPAQRGIRAEREPRGAGGAMVGVPHGQERERDRRDTREDRAEAPLAEPGHETRAHGPGREAEVASDEREREEHDTQRRVHDLSSLSACGARATAAPARPS